MPLFLHFKYQNWCLKCQKRHLSFMKQTLGHRLAYLCCQCDASLDMKETSNSSSKE